MSESKTKRGPEPVSFLAYEAALARADIVNRRLAVLLAVTVTINAAAVLLLRRK